MRSKVILEIMKMNNNSLIKIKIKIKMKKNMKIRTKEKKILSNNINNNIHIKQ